MANHNLLSLLVGFLIVGLFVIAIINGAYYFSLDNGLNSSIMNDSVYGDAFNDMTVELTNAREEAAEQKNASEQETITVGQDSLLLGSINTARKVASGSFLGVYNIIAITAKRYLGIDPIVLNTISAILIFMVILLAWRLIRVGT